MNNNREWIRTAVFAAIAAVVLLCGIYVSSRKKEESPESVSEDVLPVAQTDESEQTTDVLPVAQTDEPQYLDLFSSIHMYAMGIYPDIQDIQMTGDENDTFVKMLSYEVTNVSDFTVHGAEIAVEVDPNSISEYLEERNYTPYSLTNTFTINPKKMDSYLIDRTQLSDDVKNEIIGIAAGAVTGSSENSPLCSALILPSASTKFTPPENSYAGLYGIYSFFQMDGGVRAAFVCPVIAADGTLKSHEITLSDTYDEYIAAYKDLVVSRLESNETLMVELVQEGNNDD